MLRIGRTSGDAGNYAVCCRTRNERMAAESRPLQRCGSARSAVMGQRREDWRAMATTMTFVVLYAPKWLKKSAFPVVQLSVRVFCRPLHEEERDFQLLFGFDGLCSVL